MEEPLAALRALASQQDGQFATAQASNLRMASSAIRWLQSRGEITKVRHGVWRFTVAAGAPDLAITAFLACWPDAVIARRSAAAFHNLRRVRAPDEPEVVVATGTRRRPEGVKVHVSRNLPACDVLKVGPLRYTTLARTVCDLADPARPWDTLAIVDDAVALGASHKWIHQRAADLASGRGGVGLVRDVTRPGGSAVFRSWLERTAAGVYRAAGLPPPQWNVPINDNVGRIGIVDALWAPWSVISEKEGLRFHTTPLQRRKDAERFNRLNDVGYAVRRFTWEDVVGRPEYVAQQIHKALVTAGADLARLTLPSRFPDPPSLPLGKIRGGKIRG